MKVYIYTEAMYTPDEYIDVFDTKAFKTLEEALAYKNERKRVFLDNEENENWDVDYGDDDDAFSTHLSYRNDEAVLTVSAHEI